FGYYFGIGWLSLLMDCFKKKGMAIMKKRVVTLLILVLGFSLLYIGLDFFQLTAYVQKARLTKLLSFLIVILLIVPPTIVFQTIVNSRYLSPSIIGMDAVYVLI